MEFSTIILYAIFLTIGIMIGFNLRNAYAEDKEKRTLQEVDLEIRERLKVAQELNHSLLDDLAYAKKKLAAAQNCTIVGAPS